MHMFAVDDCDLVLTILIESGAVVFADSDLQYLVGTQASGRRIKLIRPYKLILFCKLQDMTY